MLIFMYVTIDFKICLYYVNYKFPTEIFESMFIYI